MVVIAYNFIFFFATSSFLLILFGCSKEICFSLLPTTNSNGGSAKNEKTQNFVALCESHNKTFICTTDTIKASKQKWKKKHENNDGNTLQVLNTQRFLFSCFLWRCEQQQHNSRAFNFQWTNNSSLSTRMWVYFICIWNCLMCSHIGGNRKNKNEKCFFSFSSFFGKKKNLKNVSESK